MVASKGSRKKGGTKALGGGNVGGGPYSTTKGTKGKKTNVAGSRKERKTKSVSGGCRNTLRGSVGLSLHTRNRNLRPNV